jgi:hypothetical protein
MSRSGRNEERESGQDDGPDDLATAIEHEPNVNQIRREPVPASHHEDRRPEAVRRNEEAAADSAAKDAETADDEPAGDGRQDR